MRNLNFQQLEQEIVRIVDDLDEHTVPYKAYAQTYARHIVAASVEYGNTGCRTQLLYVVSNLEGAPEIALRRIQRVAAKYGIDIAGAVDEVLHSPGENPPPFPVVTPEEEMHHQQYDRIHDAIDAVIDDPKNAGPFDLHVAQTLARISDRLSMPGAERMLARLLATGRRAGSYNDLYVLRRELYNVANMMGADEIEMLFDDAFTMQARMATGYPVHHARANSPRRR